MMLTRLMMLRSGYGGGGMYDVVKGGWTLQLVFFLLFIFNRFSLFCLFVVVAASIFKEYWPIVMPFVG